MGDDSSNWKRYGEHAGFSLGSSAITAILLTNFLMDDRFRASDHEKFIGEYNEFVGYVRLEFKEHDRRIQRCELHVFNANESHPPRDWAIKILTNERELNEVKEELKNQGR